FLGGGPAVGKWLMILGQAMCLFGSCAGGLLDRVRCAFWSWMVAAATVSPRRLGTVVLCGISVQISTAPAMIAGTTIGTQYGSHGFGRNVPVIGRVLAGSVPATPWALISNRRYIVLPVHSFFFALTVIDVLSDRLGSAA